MWRLLVICTLVVGCKPEDLAVQAAAEQERALEARIEAEQKMRAVEQEKRTLKAAEEAEQKMLRLEKEASEIIAKINEAIGAVDSAQNDAERHIAKLKLAALQKEHAELNTQIAEAKAATARAKRLRGFKISDECQDNPLAKGC